MRNEQIENTVVTLHSKGWSIRRISRELHISRKRIHRILVSKSVLRDTTPQERVRSKRRRASKLDPYKDYISEVLKEYPDITGQRIYEKLREKGFDGEITIVRGYLKRIGELGSKTPVRMVETDPGQRASHDWSDYHITFTSTGEKEKVTFFSYILGYSRRQYISVVEDKTQRTLMRELIAAFIYMDGVPREIKSDNQKACVDRWELGGPVYNRRYLEFATWYLFRPLTITPGNPTENLKVERAFYYLELSFLRGRKFKDRDDLKQQLQQWLHEVSDTHVHTTTKRRPVDLYTEEYPCLQPLPRHHYDTSHITHQVVNQESCIQWKGYHYVVSQKYMYELCPVRVTEEELIVYSPDGEQLVVHPLAKEGQRGRYVGVQQKKGKATGPDIKDVISRLKAFSPDMNEYINQLKKHKKTSWGHHLRKLLALKVKYRVEDIVLAVRRAHEHRVYDAATIEGFLNNNSESRYNRLLIQRRKNKDNEQ
jgi:transposase